jgi:hypothetical protein
LPDDKRAPPGARDYALSHYDVTCMAGRPRISSSSGGRPLAKTAATLRSTVRGPPQPGRHDIASYRSPAAQPGAILDLIAADDFRQDRQDVFEII